jgi:uncharacterized protein YndB with AHSA1/START domain
MTDRPDRPTPGASPAATPTSGATSATPPELRHLLDRAVVIRARRSTVFRYFTDPARFAAWWGAGSRIEGRRGGEVHIRYPNGVTAGGEVLELVPDQRIVFSYGYDDPEKPISRGGSRVTITLEEHPEGTLLRLTHALADASTRDAHVPGWRFQLSLFASAVASELATDLPTRVDRFFALWSEPDPAARATALADLVTDDVVFRDGFAALTGPDDLAAHIAASQQHMPGLTLTREGAPLHCQGTALVDWVARAPDGTPRARGTNVLDLAPDGRLHRIVGLWRP